MPSVHVWAFPRWTSHVCRPCGASDPAPSARACPFNPSASQTCRCSRALVKILSVTVCILPTSNFPICHRSGASGAGRSAVLLGLFNPCVFRTCHCLRASAQMHSLDVSIFPAWIFRGCRLYASIGDGAFRLCNSLQSISLANLPLLESIGDDAFYSCLHLSSVHLSDLPSLRSIGHGAFYDCGALQYVTVTNLPRLEIIGDGAFSGCVHLPIVDFSCLSSLRSIGEAAFRMCKSLHSISLAKFAAAREHAEMMPSLDVTISPTRISQDCRLFAASGMARSKCASLFIPSASRVCPRALGLMLSLDACISPT